MIVNGKEYESKDIRDFFNKCELCDVRGENGECPMSETCGTYEFFKLTDGDRQDYYETTDCDDCIFQGRTCSDDRNTPDRCENFVSYRRKED